MFHFVDLMMFLLHVVYQLPSGLVFFMLLTYIFINNKGDFLMKKFSENQSIIQPWNVLS